MAIDAFRLIAEPRTSGAVLVSEIVRELHQQAAIAQIRLVLPRQPDGDFLFGDLLKMAKVTSLVPRRPCYPENGFARNAHWIQVVIPGILRTEDIGYFIAPYHQTPLFLSRSVRVMTVIADICGLLPSAGYVYHRAGPYRHWFNFLTALARADGFSYISRYTKKAFEGRFGVAKRKPSLVIYPRPTCSQGLDARQCMRIVGALGLQPKKYFFAFGAPGIRKGTDVALAAYGLYREQGGDKTLVLAGSAALRGLLQESAANATWPMTFLTNLSNTERDAVYSQAVALLFTSRCEGYGYPIIEAMQQGCPVIALKDSPAEEIIGGCIPMLDQLSALGIAGLMGTYGSMTPQGRSEIRDRVRERAVAFLGERKWSGGYVDLLRAIS